MDGKLIRHNTSQVQSYAEILKHTPKSSARAIPHIGFCAEMFNYFRRFLSAFLREFLLGCYYGRVDSLGIRPAQGNRYLPSIRL